MKHTKTIQYNWYQKIVYSSRCKLTSATNEWVCSGFSPASNIKSPPPSSGSSCFRCAILPLTYRPRFTLIITGIFVCSPWAIVTASVCPQCCHCSAVRTGSELFQFCDNFVSLDLELWQLHLFVVTNWAFFCSIHPMISDVLYWIGICLHTHGHTTHAQRSVRTSSKWNKNIARRKEASARLLFNVHNGRRFEQQVSSVAVRLQQLTIPAMS